MPATRQRPTLDSPSRHGPERRITTCPIGHHAGIDARRGHRQRAQDRVARTVEVEIVKLMAQVRELMRQHREQRTRAELRIFFFGETPHRAMRGVEADLAETIRRHRTERVSRTSEAEPWQWPGE